jgi:segregation and condensation protein B
MSLKAKLEAVIYAAEEPVTLAQLAALFAADALEWKAEQEAASAAAELAPQTTEPLPLLNTEFDYIELEQVPEPDIAPQAEPFATTPEDAAQTSEAPTPPEPAPEAPSEALDGAPAEPAPEVPADPEVEAKRLARQRDREVRAILRGLLDQLIATYASDDRGIEIKEIAGGYRMATKPECHDAARMFVKSLKPALKLSLPALETLAVIAYKQPVTAPEVNEIRGVDSSGVFGSLLARKLIATAGRKQVIGRPILYKTTREFLLRFGLKDVSELPSMEEFEKIAQLEFEDMEATSEAEAAAEVDEDASLEAHRDDEPSDEPPEDPNPAGIRESLVTGYDYSHAADPAISTGASQAAERPESEGGWGFNPSIKPSESASALAEEELLDLLPPEIPTLPVTGDASPEADIAKETQQHPETAATADSEEAPATEEKPDTPQLLAETTASEAETTPAEAEPAAPPPQEQAETETVPND